MCDEHLVSALDISTNFQLRQAACTGGPYLHRLRSLACFPYTGLSRPRDDARANLSKDDVCSGVRLIVDRPLSGPEKVTFHGHCNYFVADVSCGNVIWSRVLETILVCRPDNVKVNRRLHRVRRCRVAT
jgi:hypothetical protein